MPSLESSQYNTDCFLCSKRFFPAGDLKAHLKIHAQEKPCKCSLCDYACKTNGQFKHLPQEVELRKEAQFEEVVKILAERRFKRKVTTPKLQHFSCFITLISCQVWAAPSIILVTTAMPRPTFANGSVASPVGS